MLSFFYGSQTLSYRDPKLDSQRANLIQSILSIPDDINHEKCEQIFFLLKNLFSIHFSYEEKKMYTDDYPKFVEHVQEHYQILKEIKQIQTRSLSNAGKGRSIKRFLLSWFENHTEIYDQEYLDFCQNKLVIQDVYN